MQTDLAMTLFSPILCQSQIKAFCTVIFVTTRSTCLIPVSQNMQINTFPITLTEAHMLSPNVKHFVFQSDLFPAFNYLPGQFITMHFEHEGKMLKRSYSIANVPSQNNRIEFAAGFVEHGPGSKLLFNLQKGENIQINGPFGRLILKDTPPKRYILAATSTGITPYRAMLTELSRRLDADPQLRVVILLGVQTKEDILYADNFMDFTQLYRNQVIFRVQLSRNKEATLLPYVHSGYVQHAFPDLALNPQEDMVYLCGNPGMIDESFEELKKRDFPMQQIVREKYISAK